MSASAPAQAVPDQLTYDRAIEQINAGNVQAGARLLGELARATRDDELRSLCLYRLGEVLEQLGQVEQAYGLWYELGHKPAVRRNATDLTARMRVLNLFDEHGLRLRPPDFPPKVQIEITNRCNLRCVMCTRNQLTRPTADLSLTHFRRIADECSREPGVLLSLFFLGEPLLHPQLEEMVAHLHAVRERSAVPLRFAIQTNGMLLTRARARALLAAGLREISFSVDGLEGDLERVRPGARYEVVERNILDLLALRGELGLTDLHVAIAKLCDDPQADEVRRFLERWQERVDEIRLLPITKVAGNAFLNAAGEIERIGAEPMAGIRRYCGQGARLLVLADGRYAFCFTDINGDIDLGHVEQESIREVWNAPRMAALRAQIQAADYSGLKPCATCPLTAS